jgi:hypothetical protein
LDFSFYCEDLLMSRQQGPRTIRLPGTNALHRTARRRTRNLRIEGLERRLVLSSLPEVLATVAEPTGESVSATAPLTDLANDSAQQVDMVFQTADGVVHVQPPTGDTPITVRQFIDYQAQSVVEIDLDGHWTAYPVDSVTEIQVHALSDQQSVVVSANVMVPVEVIDTAAIDAAYAQSDLLSATSSAEQDAALLSTDTDLWAAASLPSDVPPASPLDPPPPGGGGMPENPPPPPELIPPTITYFDAQSEGNIWRFYGQVTDDKPTEGIKVFFGGVLQGRTTLVDQFGFFELIVQLPPPPPGYTQYASAYAVDRDAMSSKMVVIPL